MTTIQKKPRIGQVNPIAHLTNEDLEAIGRRARRDPPVGHRHAAASPTRATSAG